MRRGTKVTDPALPVVLTDSALLERSKQLAGMVGDIEQAEAWIDAERKRFRALPEWVEHTEAIAAKRRYIKARREEAQRLAEVVRRQEEFRDQSTLTFDEDPTASRAGAQRDLAAVAQATSDGAVEFDPAAPPTTCGKCGAGVRQMLHGFMCAGTDCDWIARPRGRRLDGTPLEVEGDADATPTETEPTEFDGVDAPELEKQNPARCPGEGCDVVLESAIERIKGVCADCEARELEDDPRPRCAECGERLTPHEVGKGVGVCDKCCAEVAEAEA